MFSRGRSRALLPDFGIGKEHLLGVKLPAKETRAQQLLPAAGVRVSAIHAACFGRAAHLHRTADRSGFSENLMPNRSVVVGHQIG